MVSANGNDTNEEEEIHRALCVRHPNCREFHFCLDCSLVFCADCRKLEMERVNHLKHRTEPLQNVLNQRKEQMAAILKLIKDYTKHDTTMEAMLKLQEEQFAQLDYLNKSVEEFASQLVAEVENLKVEVNSKESSRDLV